MFLRTTMLGMLFVCSLWIESTIAGSSFLSPEPKSQQRKVSQKQTTKLYRRDAEMFLDGYGDDIKRDTNEIEIKFSAPFEIGMKISEQQYKEYGHILEKFVEDMLAENNEESPEKN